MKNDNLIISGGSYPPPKKKKVGILGLFGIAASVTIIGSAVAMIYHEIHVPRAPIVNLPSENNHGIDKGTTAIIIKPFTASYCPDGKTATSMKLVPGEKVLVAVVAAGNVTGITKSGMNIDIPLKDLKSDGSSRPQNIPATVKGICLG